MPFFLTPKHHFFSRGKNHHTGVIATPVFWKKKTGLSRVNFPDEEDSDSWLMVQKNHLSHSFTARAVLTLSHTNPYTTLCPPLNWCELPVDLHLILSLCSYHLLYKVVNYSPFSFRLLCWLLLHLSLTQCLVFVASFPSYSRPIYELGVSVSKQYRQWHVLSFFCVYVPK